MLLNTGGALLSKIFQQSRNAIVSQHLYGVTFTIILQKQQSSWS